MNLKGTSEADVQEVVARLAGGVAHDLNNILLVVQGYAEMVLAEPDAGPGVRSLLSEMTEATARASLLVKDLLLVGGRRPFSPRALDLAEAVERQLPRLEAACPAGVEIHAAIARGLPPVMADEVLLGRLLEALCGRAREAMFRGGVISITAEHRVSDTSHPIVLTIHDTGAPLGDEARRHLFEPYRDAPSGGKGQGLGMSVAYAAAKHLGGEIRVPPVSSGTAIEVALPSGRPRVLVEPSAAPTASPAPQAWSRDAKPRTGETILLAEDDESLRALAVKLLSREGYAVLSASDGNEAVQLFERDSHRISLALLDDVMPIMGGRAALARIRETAPDLPAILCSGYGWQLEEGAAQHAGCQTLQKPWQPRDLLRRVRECLESHR